MDDLQRSIWTHLQHLGEDVDEKPHGAVVPPIYQTSLFAFSSVAEFRKAQASQPNTGPYVYSRMANPSAALPEKKIAQLEKAEACRLTSSGMSAISAAILNVIRNAGGKRHVLCLDTAYGPAREFFSTYLKPFGIIVEWFDGLSVAEFERKIQDDTCLVYLESPSSIIMRLQDLRKIASICRARGITTIIDSTYNAGILMNPIELGIDVVVHSVTKYMCGHSDVVAGCVCGTKKFIDRLSLEEIQFLGALLPPFPAWLINRGLRTMPLRVQRSSETAAKVATWLKNRPEIARVNHVGMSDDPEQKRIFEAQMLGSGALFSFEPINQDPRAIESFVDSLELFQIGVSWGGHESLATPHVMQPTGYDKPTHMVRFYTGLEDPQDLIADIERALVHLKVPVEA